MSQEAVRELSIPELLRLLGAKLDEEYSQLREIALSSGTSPATPLDSEVCFSCLGKMQPRNLTSLNS